MTRLPVFFLPATVCSNVLMRFVLQHPVGINCWMVFILLTVNFFSAAQHQAEVCVLAEKVQGVR